MQLLNVYGVYDVKSESYVAPIYERTDGLAVRQITDVVNSGKSPFSKHPEDYILYCLATFNDCSGEYIKLDTPRHIIALTAIQPENAIEPHQVADKVQALV